MDVLGEDAGARRLPPADWPASAEDELDLVWATQIEVVADDRLEELAAVERAVEDLGARHLELKDGELVGVTRAAILVGEGVGKVGDPAVEEALDVLGAEAPAQALEGGDVIDVGDAVVEGLDVVAAQAQALDQPLVAIEPDPDAEGSVGAELDEA